MILADRQALEAFIRKGSNDDDVTEDELERWGSRVTHAVFDLKLDPEARDFGDISLSESLLNLDTTTQDQIIARVVELTHEGAG